LGRTSKKRGCPISSNLFVQQGYNDLASNYPDMALEADGWDPSTVVLGTEQKMPWKCSFGHKWTTSVKHRTGTNPTNCPPNMDMRRQASDNSKDEIIIILEMNEDSSINKNLSGQQFGKK
jgi:hypothetical protein